MTTKALSSTNILSFFLRITNFSPLITPNTFAFNSGNLCVNLESSVLTYAFVQVCFYFNSLLVVIFYVLKSINQSLQTDSEILTKFTAYIIRSSFWAVLIVGVADFIVSFMAVERLIDPIFSEAIKFKLINPAFRITFIHFPLILASFVVGYFTRSVGFIWLAVLVVGSEFLIVLSRFIFSY